MYGGLDHQELITAYEMGAFCLDVNLFHIEVLKINLSFHNGLSGSIFSSKSLFLRNVAYFFEFRIFQECLVWNLER